jgi:hypothetical protein
MALRSFRSYQQLQNQKIGITSKGDNDAMVAFQSTLMLFKIYLSFQPVVKVKLMM